MARNTIALVVMCAASAVGCAEVTVEDPPSMRSAGDLADPDAAMNPGGIIPSNGNPPVIPMGNPNPNGMTGTERPNPIPNLPNGGSGGGSSPNPANGGTAGTAVTPSVPLGPSGMELLFDDFEDGNDDGWLADAADGNDELGVWAVVPAEEGMVYAQSDASFDDDSWSVGGNFMWTDVALETRFRFTSVASIEDAVVMAAVRFQSKEKYYFFEYGGDGTVKIRRELEGDSELASEESDHVAQVGQWITLRFVAQGSSFQAFIDGDPVLTGAVDTALPSGGIALGVKENSAVEFDDVRVTLP